MISSVGHVQVVFISLLHVSLAFRWFAYASFSPVGQTDGAGHGRQVFGIDSHLLRKGLKHCTLEVFMT